MASLRPLPRSTASPDAPGPGEDIALVTLGRLVLRHRRPVLGLGLVLAALVSGYTLLRPRTYTSTAAFMPQSSEGNLSRLSALASQFGLPIQAEESGASPAFYASLLKSRDVLRNAVLTRYPVGKAGDSARSTLVELYEVSGKSAAERRDEAVKKLSRNLDVRVADTEVITVEVETPWRLLSQQVVARLIELVSEFNLRTRQTRAGSERRFVEARLSDTKAELTAAEDRLQAFLQRNRDYRNAPQLAFEYDRLQREVSMRQQLYSSLAQSYEQARIDEVRNTPVITVVEPPDLPTRPNPRRTVLKGLLGLIVGLLMGTFLLTLRHAFRGVAGGEVPPETRTVPLDVESAVPQPGTVTQQGPSAAYGKR